MPRLLLTHSPEARANYFGERALAGLRDLGEVVLHEGAAPLEGEALVHAARDCDLVVSYRQSPGPAALFERLPRLVAFLRCAIDIRNVDVAAASRAGVLVTQASAGFVTSVSELVFGFMIDLSRGIGAASAAYHAARVPAARMGRELKGATLGVIGYGQIGREVVRLGEAFGMKVLICDPYAAGVPTVGLEALLAESDYVLPLAVATEETENLMGEKQFQAMKPGAYLVNVSRGNLVDEAALLRALDSGRLGGCALDVGRARDQMPTPALAARGDVIATPHAAGLTLPAIEHQSMETVAQAAEILQGRAPKGALNAQHWTRKALLRT
jgi:D-3-phosphoglycerate dehydrogenase / 2-oxoglutarate reductase